MKIDKIKMSPSSVLAVAAIAILCVVGISMCSGHATECVEEDSSQWIRLHNGDTYTIQQVVYVIGDEVNFLDDKGVMRHVKLDDIWRSSPTAAKYIAQKVNNTK